MHVTRPGEMIRQISAPKYYEAAPAVEALPEFANF